MDETVEDPILRKQRNFQSQWLLLEGKLGRIKYYINPLTTLSVFIVVWTIIIWLLTGNETEDKLATARQWIADVWSWLYIAEQVVWVVLIVFIYFKWGDLKLGRDEDVPEYNDLSYFVMIFCTGLSSAKYYAGTSDPIDKLDFIYGGNTSLVYWGKSERNEMAQNSINITLFHWGVHGFAIYTLPALTIAFLAYRKGLPVTARTLLYPLYGHKIYGRIGDLADVLNICVLFFGVAVGLSVSTNIIITGLHEWFEDLEVDKTNKIVTLWVLIAMATISVLSGIGLGIKHLSYLTFGISCLVWFVVLFVSDTWYLLNVFIQSCGFYLQNFVGMSFHTAAFEDVTQVNEKIDANWMRDNTLFYLGWWIAVAPLTGVFIAHISRGRKIKELIMYSFFMPVVCLFLWLSIFGGAAIDMQFRALSHPELSCNGKYYANQSRSNLADDLWDAFENISGKIDNLVCLEPSARFFSVLRQYDDVSRILYFLTMLGMILQFVTHADSSSLVVDLIASNGDRNPPVQQRALWALTQGAAATAFIYYDTEQSLLATKSIAIIAAFPLIFILNGCAVALWRTLQNEKGFDLNTEFREWNMRYGHFKSIKDVGIALICPWWFMGKIAIHERGRVYRFKLQKILVYISFALPFYLWIILLIAQVKVKNIDKFGWALLLFFFAYSAYYRQRLREHRKLHGNFVEDFFVMMCYPFSIIQMYNEAMHGVHHRDSEAHDTLELPPIYPTVERSQSNHYYKQSSLMEQNGQGFMDTNLDRQNGGSRNIVLMNGHTYPSSDENFSHHPQEEMSPTEISNHFNEHDIDNHEPMTFEP